MRPDELFLSHASDDREFADRLAAVLRRHGIPVWYSRTDLVGAHQWHDEIGAALVRCDWFLLVLSPNSIGSMWVKRELLFALQDKRFERRIIPAILAPCDYETLSWTLSLFQMVDFTQPFDTACRELLRIWGIGYKP